MLANLSIFNDMASFFIFLFCVCIVNLISFGLFLQLSGEDIVDSFSDGKQVEQQVIDYIVACLRYDDIVHRVDASGYRIFISPDFL